MLYSCIAFGTSNVSGCSRVIYSSSWGVLGFRSVMYYSSVGLEHCYSSLIYEFYVVFGSQLSYHQALCFIMCCVTDCNLPYLFITTHTGDGKIQNDHSSFLWVKR